MEFDLTVAGLKTFASIIADFELEMFILGSVCTVAVTFNVLLIAAGELCVCNMQWSESDRAVNFEPIRVELCVHCAIGK